MVLSRGLVFSAAAVILVVVGYSNCSPARFETTSNLPSRDNPQIISQLLKSCADAGTSGKLQKLNQKIVFDDTKAETGRKVVCEFGKDQNLGQVEGKMQARYEQVRALNLPPNVVICDLSMSSQAQSFRYDDVFFLTLNDRLLASNNNKAVAARLSKETLTLSAGRAPGSIYKFDWPAIRTGGFENVADDYCAGKELGVSSCKWPVSEQQGQIAFDFDPEILVNFGAKASAAGQKLSFVITGDNDEDLDCYHERLELDVTVQYFIP